MAGMAHAPGPSHARKTGGDHLWVLAVIAFCCLIKVWPSWVGIGAEARFPKIGHMPTDWTLAVVVEAYWAYAVYAWLAASAGRRSRRFAMWSAAGVFVLSVAVQSAAGLMSVKEAGAVANAMPVTVLALIAILIHMRHLDRAEADEAGERSAVQAEMDALRAERDTAQEALADAQRAARETAAERANLERKLDAANRAKKRATAPRNGRAKQTPSDVDARTRALKVLGDEPAISGAELGIRVGMSKRWGQLNRPELAAMAADLENG